jgi:heme oxygenase
VSTDSTEVRLARIEERMAGVAMALADRTVEIERRLEDLNHAHAKNIADKAFFVSEDKFGGFVKEIQAWQRQVDTQLSELSGRAGGAIQVRNTSQQNWVLVLMGLALLVATAVAFLK